MVHSRPISLQENKHMNASPSQHIREQVITDEDHYLMPVDVLFILKIGNSDWALF